MIRTQGTKTSRMPLVGTRTPPIKITKTDQLAVAMLTVFDDDERVQKRANEMIDSAVFSAVLKKSLEEITGAGGDEDLQSIYLSHCLARLDVVRGIPTNC